MDMKPLLLVLHHGLQSIGKAIGLVVRIALVAFLFVGVLGVLPVSLIAAAEIAGLVGLVGVYVVPHVQPQVIKAVVALLQEAPSP
jgi:hypothetical protein